MNEEVYAATQDFQVARNKLILAKTFKEGGGNDDLIYARAYQQLVKLGIAPQLKKKYRTGKHFRMI